MNPDPAVQAMALAEALDGIGFSTSVRRSPGFDPCVIITCGPSRHVTRTRYVYAAPEGEAGPWFFWLMPSPDNLGEDRMPVAPIGNVAKALDYLTPEITLPIGGKL